MAAARRRCRRIQKGAPCWGSAPPFHRCGGYLARAQIERDVLSRLSPHLPSLRPFPLSPPPPFPSLPPPPPLFPVAISLGRNLGKIGDTGNEPPSHLPSARIVVADKHKKATGTMTRTGATTAKKNNNNRTWNKNLNKNLAHYNNNWNRNWNNRAMSATGIAGPITASSSAASCSAQSWRRPCGHRAVRAPAQSLLVLG